MRPRPGTANTGLCSAILMLLWSVGAQNDVGILGSRRISCEEAVMISCFEDAWCCSSVVQFAGSAQRLYSYL